MRKLSIAILTFTLALAASASSTLLARQRAPFVANEPGMPTVARMYVLNRDASEAIPVTIHGGSDVQAVAVMSMPAVTLAATSSVGARATRQAWEYRRISVPAAQDPTDALNEAGADGWEAVSVSTAGGTSQILLKRPR